MKFHLLAGFLFVQQGLAACSFSHESPVPAPVIVQPADDRADEQSKPLRGAKKSARNKDKDQDQAAAAPGRRDSRTLNHDAAKRMTLLLYILRSPLGGG